MQLQALFCLLKSLSEYYKTGHWQSKNSIYYGDHLLLDRLSSESEARLDQIAEKIIGITQNPALLNLSEVLKKQFEYAKSLPYTPEENSVFFQSGLSLEQKVLEMCKLIDSAADTSVGVKNMLGDIADESEARVYLLKQRLNSGTPAKKITT